jgi:hypothetical protein
MNYLKRFTILLLPLIMIACSDDDCLNTGAATVEFQSAEIEIKELASSLNLPIVVKGENDGRIKLRIEMKDNNTGFENDKDILITDYNLIIPAGVKSVNVETLLSIANDEIEQNRSFSIAIVNAEGATIGGNATCKVNILENSPLEGKYMMEGKSQLQTPNGVTGYACTLTSTDDSFEQLYLDFGQGGAALVEVEPTENLGEYKLTIAANQTIGTYNGDNVKLAHKTILNGRWINTTDPITGTFKNKIVTFEMGHALGLEVPAVEGWLGLVGSYTDESGKSIPLKLIKQ